MHALKYHSVSYKYAAIQCAWDIFFHLQMFPVLCLFPYSYPNFHFKYIFCGLYRICLATVSNSALHTLILINVSLYYFWVLWQQSLHLYWLTLILHLLRGIIEIQINDNFIICNEYYSLEVSELLQHTLVL